MKLTFDKIKSKVDTETQDGRDFTIYTFFAKDDKGETELYKTFSKRVEEVKAGDVIEGEVMAKEYKGQQELIFTFPKTFSGKGYTPRSNEERWEIIRQNALGHALKYYELTKEKIDSIKSVMVRAEAFARFSKGELKIDLEKEIEALKKEETPDEAMDRAERLSKKIETAEVKDSEEEPEPNLDDLMKSV